MLEVAADNSVLVDNLRRAYETEVVTHARYIAFARKADKDGCHGAGSLFRAVARAEQVHAGNHGRILSQLGGLRPFELAQVELEFTPANLRAALASELYEGEIVYPALIRQATLCRDPAVVRSFRWAMLAETTHARLFASALDRLEQEDSAMTAAEAYLICPVCGYGSVRPQVVELRPACHCACKKFEEVR